MVFAMSLDERNEWKLELETLLIALKDSWIVTLMSMLKEFCRKKCEKSQKCKDFGGLLVKFLCENK